MLAAYSVARVVPPLARVLSPAIAGFTSSAISAASGAPGQPRRRVRPDVRFDVPKASKRWDNRGLDRATAPAGQTTSRRLAEVLRAPPSSPSSVIAKPTPSSVAKPTPMLSARTHKNLVDSQPKPFTSFKIHPGLQQALEEALPNGKTTPIQTLALSNLLAKPHKLRALLGAETGSGKTLAYLVPLMHHLKRTDVGPPPAEYDKISVTARALVLGPTHELTRQSTSVAKHLSRSAKLRVIGTSWNGPMYGYADVLLATGRGATSLLGLPYEARDRPGRPRPTKETNDTKPKTFREYLNLGDTEWLVIDEADVLLGPDFINETSRVVKRVLAASPNVNVLLVTATLPPSLVRVLEGDLFGGEFTHLLSPGLHRLPKQLDTRFVPWSGGGNRVSDIVHEVKRGFAEDALDAKLSGNEGKPRAVVFCSSVGQVKAITTALEEKAVAALAWTGDSPERVRGRDGPLEAFLARGQATDPKGPRVLVTTSLLSRGLDFSADVTTIYLVDPPRDVLDFVHRAGRAGRAGRHGRVVVFGVNGANELKYGKEIKSVLGKVERRQAVKPGGRTWSGKDKERSRK